MGGAIRETTPAWREGRFLQGLTTKPATGQRARVPPALLPSAVLVMSEFEQREQSIRLLDEHRDSLAAEERELVAKDPSAGSSPATASSEVGQLAAAPRMSWRRRK